MSKAYAFGMRVLLLLAPQTGAKASVEDIDSVFWRAGILAYPVGFEGLLALPGGGLQFVALARRQRYSRSFSR